MKKFGATKIIEVEARTLRPHPTAQREISASHLRNLTAAFDLNYVGVLSAVEYEIDGVMAIWITDGQHRWQILMDLGLGEWVVPVQVFVDVKDEAQSCDLFIELNNSQGVKPFFKFKAKRAAGRPAAVGAANIVEARGLTIHRNVGDGRVVCVKALEKIFNVDGGRTLELTLDTILAAWGPVAAALEGKLIEGLGMVYATHKGAVDKPSMVKKLAKLQGGPSGLIGSAKQMKDFMKVSMMRATAEKIIHEYNSGRTAGRLDSPQSERTPRPGRSFTNAHDVLSPWTERDPNGRTKGITQ